MDMNDQSRAPQLLMTNITELPVTNHNTDRAAPVGWITKPSPSVCKHLTEHELGEGSDVRSRITIKARPYNVLSRYSQTSDPTECHTRISIEPSPPPITMSPKTIAVLGATGVQGGSVVRALLKDKSWKIRGITRDASKEGAKALEKQGVEVVSANINDEQSLRQAFEAGGISARCAPFR